MNICLSRGVGAYAACILALPAGCDVSGVNESRGPGQADNSAEEPELGQAIQPVLVGTCTFVSLGGVMTVTSTAAQSIQITARAVDSAILVGGSQCGTATVQNLKYLTVNGSNANENVILDFLVSYFDPGVQNSVGIQINLGGGTDQLGIRAKNNTDDLVYIGADGINFNGDAYKDVNLSGVESISVSLGNGNDTLVASNPAAPTVTKGVSGSATVPITVSGGDGDDVLVGGAANDTLNGQAGSDIIEGGEGSDVADCGADADAAFSVGEAVAGSVTCEVRFD